MHVILVLQLLVLELALQLLRLGDFAHRPVEVVLIDHVPLGLERKEPTSKYNVSRSSWCTSYGLGLAGHLRLCHHVSEISTV